ncbi:glycosyltransferase family 2 protein [Ramlibacter tataouinensis]|uniref:Candidate b-glycosyltransferase, Glycosyltransferase Family 2 n=1 Tax=Ramlibacter tataouinensis (strain ATCC BAA-407 / DSM 14655 / LMG 21543 / TTB310) TaxID=365046 RepID=F5XYM6_RAMTT|nr:glycosyltransferase family 2 protein [Ramlibacter tataouinensis]AEG93202.1 candidate b-glycosyltransferase, Glycosyltransferase Family 2 [Ramlibacter tataouinensis TTB310]
MRTAFVVLTYNRSDALLAVLRGLAPQCAPDDQVVVADDGSRPEHVHALRAGLPRFPCPVRHVWHPDVGFTAARARNLGALHAPADYLVFMDGDCVPNPRFVAQHRRLAEPGAFVNGSRVLLSERLSRRVLAGEIDPGRLPPAQWLRLRLAGDVNKLAHLVRWTGAPGRREPRFRWRGIRSCNFGLWRGDLEAVNGFDESFSGWGHEDADLVLRLHNQGLARKNGFLSTEVFHLWHRENSRAGEAANRARVLERQSSGLRRAAIGLAEAGNQPGVAVTELNHRQGETGA